MLVSGAIAAKAARLVSVSEPIELLGVPPRYVGRGGEKLEAALERFAVDVAGRHALDAGASTGGFTDCLLQAGASGVVAVDVGRGQLHERLRADPRVVAFEQLDVRAVTSATVGGVPVDVVTADLSFISLTRAVPVLAGEVVRPGGTLLLLVKPQFEAGRAEASRGKGVVRDPVVHRRTLGEVVIALRAAGADIMGAMASPITGQQGNVEYFLCASARRGRRGRTGRVRYRRPDARRGRRRRAPTAGAGVAAVATVAFLVHPSRPEAKALAEHATRWLTDHGHRVLDAVGADGTVTLDGADLLVSLGGDGTLLRVVDHALASGVPVLGVNIGRLGYLAQAEPDGLEDALSRFVAGRYEVEERMTLAVTVRDPTGAVVGQRVALNEATVEKTVPGHTVRIAASIDGRLFVTYAADGLLVSTPTGSTAYNLSARGPVLSPRLRAIVVTPVSPHTLFDRALVLDPAERLLLEVLEPRAAVLVIDGESEATLEPGWSVECREGDQPARLVSFGSHDFHAILRAKFRLADR